MKFTSYLNLQQLLKHKIDSKEQRRTFGLDDKIQKLSPTQQLEAWEQSHKAKLPTPRFAEQVTLYLSGLTRLSLGISFVLGIFSGLALLNYNGTSPVNVIYFMMVALFFPLLSLLVTLVSLFKVKQKKQHYGLEKLLDYLPFKREHKGLELTLDSLVYNWLFMQRAQLASLLFALGVLCTLLLTVVTQDIAFAWSTTLKISPEMFHSFLELLSSPWKTWMPSAVPSYELVEQSQYFRLGGKLEEQMLNHASQLGEWWKFLAMSTLVYVVGLRVLLYFLLTYQFTTILDKSAHKLAGAKELLAQINEPIIHTQAVEHEVAMAPTPAHKIHQAKALEEGYDVIHGWDMDKENLALLVDVMQVKSQSRYTLGGSHTLAQDSHTIALAKGSVLVYVKAWEPPTMDFMDYLEALLAVATRVTISPIGTQTQAYEAKEKERAIWHKKLSSIEDEKLWIKG